MEEEKKVITAARVIRIIATITLIYLAYLETGLWTGVSLSLIFIALEAQTFTITKQWEAIAGLVMLHEINEKMKELRDNLSKADRP